MVFPSSRFTEINFSGDENFEFSVKQASHFARLPLAGIQQEFPHKTGAVFTAVESMKRPKTLHPAFYGCFDWHSCVHGTWLLIHLLKKFPNLPEGTKIREKLNENLTEVNIKGECAFLDLPGSQSWERMYGWAWFLKLADELFDWDDPDGKTWKQNLEPLTQRFVERYLKFLPKHEYPIRYGTHSNTAFGLSFAYDFAKKTEQNDLSKLIRERALYYYAKDQNAPVAYEPSGYDFLSPSLIESNLMRRILEPQEFALWLKHFLPEASWKHFERTAQVSDRTDGHIVHLDGLNLSRAWCLKALAEEIRRNSDEPWPVSIETCQKMAINHLKASLPHVNSGDYAGEHWLASFAVYALDWF